MVDLSVLRLTPLCHFVTSPPQGGRLSFSLVSVGEAQSVRPISPLEGEMPASPAEGGMLRQTQSAPLREMLQ